MRLDIWSILILVIIFQGFFFLSALLLSAEKRKKHSTRYLLFITLLFIWFLAEFLSVRNVFKVPLDIFYGTRYGSWMLLGPLTYFYFKSVTDSTWRFSKKHWLHLLPFVIFVIIIPSVSGQSLSRRQIHYGMLAVFDHRPKTVTAFEYLYSTVFYLQFIHLASYLFANSRIIKRYRKRLKQTHAVVNNVRWLLIFNGALTACLVLASTYLYILFSSDFYSRSLDYIYVIPMGLFLYSLGYYLSGVSWQKVAAPKKYQSSSLKSAEKSALLSKLETFMQEEKPYLKNDLRLHDLASELSTNDHHLSQVINEHYQCSFFDYVNQHRITEAKRLIMEHPNHTLLKIAFEAGFNNKTSFVNAFRKFEKMTPSSFRKEKN